MSDEDAEILRKSATRLRAIVAAVVAKFGGEIRITRADLEAASASARGGLTPFAYLTDEVPLGDFRPGRFAWVLKSPVLLDPAVPARGRQQLWNWESQS